MATEVSKSANTLGGSKGSKEHTVANIDSPKTSFKDNSVFSRPSRAGVNAISM